jgi:hypothetical protein
MEDLSQKIESRKVASRQLVEALHTNRKIIEEDVRFRVMPDAPPGPVQGLKEGYLFKKKQGKALVPTWKRVYASISDGFFSYSALGKSRGQLVQSNDINVLLCEVKASDTAERRFCFEMNSVKRYFVFQAESDTELRAWLDTFEAAKKSALAARPSIGPMSLEEDVGKREEHRKSRNTESRTVQTNNEAECTDSAVQSLFSRRTMGESCEEGKGTSGNNLGSDVNVDERQAEMHVKMRAADFRYGDSVYERYNMELHQQLPGLDPLEFVLVVLPCALQKEISLQGRLYATQSHFYFYSSIFGRITLVTVPLGDVLGIQKYDYSYYSTLKLQCRDARYTFKTFVLDDARTIDAFNLLCKNYGLEQPLSITELFAKVRMPFSDGLSTAATAGEASTMSNRTTGQIQRFLVFSKSRLI